MSGATRADRGKLGGLKHRQVVRLLAAAEISRTQIAEQFDVSPSAVSQFAKKHADEIAAVRADMDDEFAGIAIASKVNRLALYDQLVEKALEPVPKVTPAGKLIPVGEDEDGQTEYVMEVDLRAAALLAKQAAEELGQIPNKVSVQGEMSVQTRYRIEGLDPGAMT